MYLFLCAEPTLSNLETSTVSTIEERDKQCLYGFLLHNGRCDDLSNSKECLYDSGECCQTNSSYKSCEYCRCLHPEYHAVNLDGVNFMVGCRNFDKYADADPRSHLCLGIENDRQCGRKSAS